MHRSTERAALLCVFALSYMTGCVGLLGPSKTTPLHVGTHAVGVTTIRVADPSRDRELDVEIWYPAARVEVEREAVVYRLRAGGTTVARLRSPTGARRHARPWRDGGPRPVILLSHGAGSSRFGNMSLSEMLASHGFVVAAPDHAGHTSADKIFGISDDDRARSALDRPLDLSRVLDDLEIRGGDQRSILRGMIDADRVGVAGHSFGGRAALGMVGARFDPVRQARECEVDPSDRRCRALPVFGAEPYRYRDPRIKAALLITPAGFDFYRADGVAQIDAPVLVVGADRDETTPYAQFHRPVFDALQPPHYLLELENAGHLTATDICEVVDSIGFFANAVGGAQAQDGCGESFLSSSVALESVVDASLPFFDLYLNGYPNAERDLHSVLAAAAHGYSG